MISKLLKIVFIFLTVFSISMISHSATETDQKKLERTLMCLCGCNTTLKDCPHLKCGFAIPAREQIAKLIAEEKSEQEVADVFLAKYGDEIFAAPRKEGFNLVGYIMPFVIIVVAGGLVFLVLKVWSSRGVADEQETAVTDIDGSLKELDDKIEKELKEMD